MKKILPVQGVAHHTLHKYFALITNAILGEPIEVDTPIMDVLEEPVAGGAWEEGEGEVGGAGERAGGGRGGVRRDGGGEPFAVNEAEE